jgi:hypothetical protein
MPRCLLWKRVPGCTIPMVPMHLPPMAPMNLVEQIRAHPAGFTLYMVTIIEIYSVKPTILTMRAPQ